MSDVPLHGPLILGAQGRIGQMFRALWDGGHWPDARPPVWFGRADWDMSGPLPDSLPPVRGVIVLAGRTAGPDLAANSVLALAALELAARFGLGPVLLCSSSAVYGAAPGPHAEDAVCYPSNPYGAAKLDMERAAAAHPTPSCALRIANVAGADMAMLNAAKGPVALDRLADGSTPKRMYAGPRSLARMILDLIDASALPPVLNVAQPGLIQMGDLLDAAGAVWSPKPAPDAVLPALALDLGLLSRLIPLDPATPASLAVEARLAGWRAA